MQQFSQVRAADCSTTCSDAALQQQQTAADRQSLMLLDLFSQLGCIALHATAARLHMYAKTQYSKAVCCTSGARRSAFAQSFTRCTSAVFELPKGYIFTTGHAHAHAKAMSHEQYCR